MDKNLFENASVPVEMPQDNAFGIQNTTLLSDDEDPIFGPSVSSDPKKVKPIEQEDKKKEVVPEPVQKVDKKELEHISILDDEDEDEDTTDDVIDQEVDEEDDTKKKKATKKVETELSETVWQAIAEEMSNQNLFVFDENEKAEDIKTPEELRDKYIKEFQRSANDYLYNQIIAPFGQEGMDMFKSVFVDGVHPKDYLSTYTELEDIENLDMTEEANQEDVMREYLSRQDYPKDKIEQKIKKLKDTADLEEEASVAHEILVKQNQKQLQELKEEAQRKKALESQYKQQYLNNIQNILSQKLKAKEFDGIPVTDKIARETMDYLYTEKWTNSSGERLTDFDRDILELRKPENHELKVKLALLLRNKLDLSKVKAKLVSGETSKLFGKLAIKDKIERRANPNYTNENFI